MLLNRFSPVLSFTLILLVLAGCGSRKPLTGADTSDSKLSASGSTPRASASPSASSSTSGTAVSFEALSNGTSRIKTAGQRSVTDSEGFDTLWEEHSGSSAIKPQVDFESESVLAVFAGQKPTGGYSIKITSVSLDGKALQVKYHETSPAKGSLNSQVLTSPAHIVKIGKAKADFSSVEFEAE